MRQRAWLEAVPEAPERRLLSDRGTPLKSVERVSRGKAILDDGRPVPLPDIPTPYLTDILFDVGPVAHTGGMGPAPLSSENLIAWQQETGIVLKPWESRTLRRLSMEYLVTSRQAEKADCPPPWAPRGADIDRDAVAKRVKSILHS